MKLVEGALSIFAGEEGLLFIDVLKEVELLINEYEVVVVEVFSCFMVI